MIVPIYFPKQIFVLNIILISHLSVIFIVNARCNQRLR